MREPEPCSDALVFFGTTGGLAHKRLPETVRRLAL